MIDWFLEYTPDGIEMKGKAKMVILFVSPNYTLRGEVPKGGVGMYMQRVARALRELGHTPIILSSGTQDRHYWENDIEVFFVRCPSSHVKINNLKRIGDILYGCYSVNKKISELINTRKIDIIQFSSIRSWPLLYYGKVPAIMRLSSYDKLYYRDYPNKAIAYARASLQCLAARRCTMVFAPSNVHANAFAKDIHRKVSVIESPFWDECSEHNDRIYQNKLAGKKYVLYFGRLTVTKGILVIAEILEKFLEKHSDYSFVCCGIEQSGNKENLAHLLKRSAGEYKERFLYMKALSHNLLYPIIQKADFVIFPSLSENFSNACMEAMHFERVVIGTDGTSYEQLIDDGKNGLLCIPGDPKSLLDKMNQAAAMGEEQKIEMGKRAKKRIDQLAPEITVKKLERLYQYVIKHT